MFKYSSFFRTRRVISTRQVVWARTSAAARPPGHSRRRPTAAAAPHYGRSGDGWLPSLTSGGRWTRRHRRTSATARATTPDRRGHVPPPTADWVKASADRPRLCTPRGRPTCRRCGGCDKRARGSEPAGTRVIARTRGGGGAAARRTRAEAALCAHSDALREEVVFSQQSQAHPNAHCFFAAASRTGATHPRRRRRVLLPPTAQRGRFDRV